MQRRDFIKSVVALGGASVLGQQVHPSRFRTFLMLRSRNRDVKRVLVMFKCHFDAGFVATQATVVDWYFSDYFPEAIRSWPVTSAVSVDPRMCGLPDRESWFTNIWSKPPRRTAKAWSKPLPAAISHGMRCPSVGRRS